MLRINCLLQVINSFSRSFARIIVFHFNYESSPATAWFIILLRSRRRVRSRHTDIENIYARTADLPPECNAGNAHHEASHRNAFHVRAPAPAISGQKIRRPQTRARREKNRRISHTLDALFNSRVKQFHTFKPYRARCARNAFISSFRCHRSVIRAYQIRNIRRREERSHDRTDHWLSPCWRHEIGKREKPREDTCMQTVREPLRRVGKQRALRVVHIVRGQITWSGMLLMAVLGRGTRRTKVERSL